MLWYKAWRESRIRFLLIALVLAGDCVFVVLRHKALPSTSSPISYAAYVYVFIYGRVGFDFLLFSPPLLAMGGLLRERGRGTAALSLSLPVSRLQLVGVRAAVGLLQMMALALVPAIFISALSPIVGESYPISAALHFGLLWTMCGSAIFAMAFLFSTVFEGEYTALVVSFIATALYQFITSMPSLQPNILRFNLSGIMGGMKIPVPRNLLTGFPDPFPWPTFFVIAVVTFALLAIATRITQQQDF
jgi:ABC-type transport system involved in multi-copper enzyme maturation permease subunit